MEIMSSVVCEGDVPLKLFCLVPQEVVMAKKKAKKKGGKKKAAKKKR